jgi:hypothetical protein
MTRVPARESYVEAKGGGKEAPTENHRESRLTLPARRSTFSRLPSPYRRGTAEDQSSRRLCGHFDSTIVQQLSDILRSAMRFHNFTLTTLAKVIRAGDSHRFAIDLVNDRDGILAGAVQTANGATLDFSPSHTARVNNRECISLKNYGACLALRSISAHLSRKFHLRLMNRDQIVLGVIRTLSDTTPVYIIRRDIKSFYESIPALKLREHLLLDTSISKAARKLLKHFFDFYCPSNTGIPRGLSLSATLAEISLADFDHKVQRLPGVYRYFRFSDDILIFCFKQPDSVMQQVEHALPDGMHFNPLKSTVIPIVNTDKHSAQPVELEYLGYRFSMINLAKGDKPRTVRVSISDRKLSKLKTRIILSFKRYSKDRDYYLLRDRIRFLSGNYRVRRDGISAIKTSSHIKSGIYYSYRQCGTYSGSNAQIYDGRELKAIDGFYFSLLKSSRSRFFWILKRRLTNQQYDELSSLSFFQGFDKRMTVRLPPSRIRDIKAAWKNA